MKDRPFKGAISTAGVAACTNEWLNWERGISFEDVVFHIEAGDEVNLFEHPNQKRNPGQKISVVLIEGYAYLVPFVESETEICLNTIIPSRKASKQYAGDSTVCR